MLLKEKMRPGILRLFTVASFLMVRSLQAGVPDTTGRFPSDGQILLGQSEAKSRLQVRTVIPPFVDRPQARGAWTLIGWNDLGMHCIDGNDYTVFSILPPFNTIHAQLISPTGSLAQSASGISVTYEAMYDPDHSSNSFSSTKTNFWNYVWLLFGFRLVPDAGLSGYSMPGPDNIPQVMNFDGGKRWFSAEGIPMTAYDDQGNKNFYPMLRLVARDSAKNVLASTEIVVPVSDEMDCRACHSSGSPGGARPTAGWVNDPDPQRDYKLNILLLHDEHRGSGGYGNRLATAGYHPAGLYPTVTQNYTPILCDRCHASNALLGTGISGVPPLTQSVHTLHAGVMDPLTSTTLESSENRSACYRCHPGSTTRCLRGAMGSAVAPNGTLAMQCQNCHGSMLTVGLSGRHGWLEEPSCQNCHSGNAMNNNGQIRYISALERGVFRVAVNSTFATNQDVPAAGLNLYRFSTGHGNLLCEACHGSTHAEYTSTHRNDNIQNIRLQGHAGMMAECDRCHGSQPNTLTGGPHGMHPVGDNWVRAHSNAAEDGKQGQCQLCHGADYRGTELSRALGDRTLSTRFGTKAFWRGFQIGCYACHNGPSSENGNSNRAPSVANLTLTTQSGTQAGVRLQGSDADGNTLTYRIVSQPSHGTVGLTGSHATYFPEAGFTGPDSFTYAAWDGSVNSNLGSVVVTVQ
jgi:hypothetical protein